MMGKGRLADSLAEAGHNVTVLALKSTIEPTAFKFTNQKIVSIGKTVEESKAAMIEVKKQLSKSAFEGFSLFATSSMMPMFSKYLRASCESALKENQKEIADLKAEKF
uniref:Uncharacterized protein n=1 Tax=Panagrolaimus sp. JU765 TaxID=591449 RepID=A0AC34Q4F0_9BILA